MKDNLKKSFFWNTLGSGLNSVNSLLLLIVVTRINGINRAGIFTLSFATACMFYFIAVYSGRTYQVTETDKEVNDSEYIINRLITSFIMILLSFLFALIYNYFNYKLVVFMLVCGFKCIDAICDVFHGILQKNNRLDTVGKSLLLRSILNILVFLIIDITTRRLIVSCISLIVTDLLILFTVDIRKSIKYIKKSINKKGIFKIFTFGFYVFGFSFISNYIMNAQRYAIDIFLKDNLQTIFGIIVMPGTVILLMNQFIIQPVIIKLKETYSNKHKKQFLNIIYKIILLTIVLSLLLIIAAYFIGIPTLNLMYGLNLENYLYDLIIILLGAMLYTIASVFSNSLIVLRKTRVQFFIYIIVAIFTTIISNRFVQLYSFKGAIYSYALTMILLLLLYVIVFFINIRKKDLWGEV